MKEEKLALIYHLAQGVGLSASDVSEYLASRHKKEILETIYQLVRKKGIPFREVSDYLSKKEKANIPPAADIHPGMFVYDDNTFKHEIIPYSRIKAVVCYVENRTVYAICLKMKPLQWSSTGLQVEATQHKRNGREATCEILKAVKEKGGRAEAAQWCYNYTEDGVEQGETFLPSRQELKRLCSNEKAINASLKALGVELLDSYIWTSNEDSAACARLSYAQAGYENSASKDIYYPVRPMLAIAV